MTARTKPGRQSECAASWLDKDGNSCGRGCCFLVSAWRAVPVVRSYRRAPLPTHKSCPIPPTLVTPACPRQSLLFDNSHPHYRCAVSLSLESILCWTLALQEFETPIVSGLSQWPTALTCRPHWVRQPKGADFTRAPPQDKLVKRYIRGPASWQPPRLPQTTRDRHFLESQ